MSLSFNVFNKAAVDLDIFGAFLRGFPSHTKTSKVFNKPSSAGKYFSSLFPISNLLICLSATNPSGSSENLLSPISKISRFDVVCNRGPKESILLNDISNSLSFGNLTDGRKTVASRDSSKAFNLF